MAKIAFPIVPGSIEVSGGGNFKGNTRGSASSKAPVAFPLAPGFIEVSVHGNFDLHAFLIVRESISAVAFPADAIILHVSMTGLRLHGLILRRRRPPGQKNSAHVASRTARALLENSVMRGRVSLSPCFIIGLLTSIPICGWHHSRRWLRGETYDPPLADPHELRPRNVLVLSPYVARRHLCAALARCDAAIHSVLSTFLVPSRSYEEPAGLWHRSPQVGLLAHVLPGLFTKVSRPRGWAGGPC
jgi:hypothetical protein